MLLKTILNQVQRHKSFVYGKVNWGDTEENASIEIEVHARTNSKALCSGCGCPGPGYDHLKTRRFEFVPLWGIAVYFLYAMRRVDCPTCGVTVERVPWSNGKGELTTTYQWFLARWAKRLAWSEVALIFNTTWEKVYASVKHAVFWGIAHREVGGVEALGVDEIQWKRGHKYLTLVYQIDSGCKRLLWIGQERTEKTLEQFFDLLGDEIRPTLRYICSDMWQPYLKVIAQRVSEAIQILDRYHIMAKMNKAIDEIRAAEARRLERDGYEPVLKHSRWCLLKRAWNRSKREIVKLRELLQYNLKTVRAYLLKEDFQRFWEYTSPTWARKFLREWCARTMRSQLEPMKKIAKTLREHEALLLNWFEAQGQISAGTVEGLNNKVKLTMRKSFGFRTFEAIEVALYHNLGNLPEPDHTHRFC
jgi:transposase